MNTKILAEVFSETDLTYIQQLDERQRRLYCATRAINIGKHGVAAMCASIHISKNTIYRGIRELNGKANLSSGTVRIAGGGRKAILDEHPEYLVLFDEIVQKDLEGSQEPRRSVQTSGSYQDILCTPRNTSSQY